MRFLTAAGIEVDVFELDKGTYLNTGNQNMSGEKGDYLLVHGKTLRIIDKELFEILFDVNGEGVMEQMKKALEFYANRKHYGFYDDASNNCPTTDVLMDDGYRAKKALGITDMTLGHPYASQAAQDAAEEEDLRAARRKTESSLMYSLEYCLNPCNLDVDRGRVIAICLESAKFLYSITDVETLRLLLESMQDSKILELARKYKKRLEFNRGK